MNNELNEMNNTALKPTVIPEFEPLYFDELNWNDESDIPLDIAVLDLEKLESGECLNELKNALKNAYPFYIKNYGISDSEIETVFNVTRDFFNKPENEKREMVHNDYPLILRGYSAYGTGAYENSINSGKSINQYTKYAWGPADNVYPDNRFEEKYTNVQMKLTSVADRVLNVIGKVMELDTDEQWGNLFDGEDTVLHCQCYYPEEPLGKDRMMTHADASSITLLNQLPAKNGHIGLQVKVGDKFIGIPAIRGTIVVMTGEALNAASKGAVSPVMHAVTGPKDDIENSERSSMPFFLNPQNKFQMQLPPDTTHGKFYNKNGVTTFGDYSNNIAKAYADTEK